MFRVLGFVMAATLAADAVAVAAIGRSESSRASAPIPATSTTAPPTPIGTFPLTGLPAYPGDPLGRPALSVKVDDAPDAHPQAGLDRADLVTEELVEGGLTRLLVTFHSHDAASVGPVRSARPEDAPLVREVGGMLAFSGASAGVLAAIESESGASLIQPTPGDGIFRRDDARPSPANLFVDTRAAYAAARGGTVPAPLFTYSTTPAAGTPARTVRLPFSGSTTAGWTWDPAASQYDRSEDGQPDVLVGGSRARATNIVILSMAVTGSNNYDVLHHQTPVEQVIGSGRCWVVRDGVVIASTWSRPAANVALGLTVALRAGTTWVELLPRPFSPTFAA